MRQSQMGGASEMPSSLKTNSFFKYLGDAAISECEKRRAAIVNLMFKQAEEIAEETNIARKKMKEHALKNSPYDDELGKSGGVVFRALSLLAFPVLAYAFGPRNTMSKIYCGGFAALVLRSIPGAVEISLLTSFSDIQPPAKSYIAETICPVAEYLERRVEIDPADRKIINGSGMHSMLLLDKCVGQCKKYAADRQEPGMFDLSHPQHKEMLARLLEEANQHAIEHPSPTQKERDASFGENDRDVSAVDFRAHIEEVLRLSSSSSSSSFSSPSTARKSQSSSLSSSPSSTSSSSFSSSASSSSRSSSMEDDYSSSSASSSFAQDSHSTHDVDQSAFSDTGYYGDDNTHAHDTHESEVTIRDDDGYYQTTFDFETDKDKDQDNVRHDDDGRYAPSLSSPAPTSSSSYRSWDDVYASHRGDQDSLGSDSEYDVNVRTGTRSADVKTPRQQTSPKKYRSWDDIRNGAREGGLESGGEQRFDNNEYRLSGGRTF